MPAWLQARAYLARHPGPMLPHSLDRLPDSDWDRPAIRLLRSRGMAPQNANALILPGLAPSSCQCSTLFMIACTYGLCYVFASRDQAKCSQTASHLVVSQGPA